MTHDPWPLHFWWDQEGRDMVVLQTLDNDNPLGLESKKS